MVNQVKSRTSMGKIIVLLLVGVLGLAFLQNFIANDPPSWQQRDPNDNEYLIDVEILPAPRSKDKLVHITATVDDVVLVDAGFRNPWGDLLWIPPTSVVSIIATQTEAGTLKCSIVHMQSQRIVSTASRHTPGKVECHMNKKPS